MTAPIPLRYTAFTDTRDGGNPAGVVVTDAALDEPLMQSIAAELGYSETAFLHPATEPDRYAVRYFSPLAEVPFCGHATIAAAVALAERVGPRDFVFQTRAGTVPVTTRREAAGIQATLTSVPPHLYDAPDALLDGALTALGWSQRDLDPALPPRVAFAGARHLILAAGSRERLAALDYDFQALKDCMLAADLTTVDLVWRESDTVFHARNPFPVGGVVEDPATGAAAAAFGAYLRDLALVTAPTRVVIHQGVDMGRPSLLNVDIPATGPISVSGGAVRLAD